MPSSAPPDHVGDIYDARYENHLAKVEDNPKARFVASIELNFEDINNLKTRHFFIQFWPFLGMVDDYSGELLAEFYRPQLRQIGELIQDLNPDIDKDEIQLRAELITALVEGLLVTTVSISKGTKRAHKLKERVITNCLAIAQSQF